MSVGFILRYSSRKLYGQSARPLRFLYVQILPGGFLAALIQVKAVQKSVDLAIIIGGIDREQLVTRQGVSGSRLQAKLVLFVVKLSQPRQCSRM